MHSLWQQLNLTGDWHKGRSQGLFEDNQTELGSDNADSRYQLLKQIVEKFRYAKTFGSLIEVDADNAESLLSLHQQLEQLTRSGDVMQKPAAQTLLPFVHQAWMLAQRYDAVIANPPYMGSKGMNAQLKDFAKNSYSHSKSDLFAIFMERGFELLNQNGFNAMVTMQSWMFLSSYENLRLKILTESSIECMAHMANMVMGIAFGTAATVCKKGGNPATKGAYCYIEYEDIGDNDRPVSFPPLNERNLKAAKKSEIAE